MAKRRKDWRRLHPEPGESTTIVEPPPLHTEVTDERCVFCTHPDRVLLEGYFQRWYSYAEIASLAKLDPRVVSTHFKATGLVERRSHNTDTLISNLMEMALDAVDPTEINLLGLIKHRDKLNGRVIDKVEQQRPSVIIIQGPPSLRSLVRDDRQDVIEGKAVELLGPGEAIRLREEAEVDPGSKE